MAVVLKPMTAEEYAEFYKTSFENHVKELMEEESLPREKAEKETAAELSQMLPDGKETAGSFLLTIHRTPAPAPVGYIWTIHEETDGIKQSFLCFGKIIPVAFKLYFEDNIHETKKKMPKERIQRWYVQRSLTRKSSSKFRDLKLGQCMRYLAH